MFALFKCLFGFLIIAKVCCASALQIKQSISPLNNSRSRLYQPRFIILHTTEGGDGAVGKLMRYGESHYLVQKRGVVLQILAEDRVALHAGRSMWNGLKGLNRYSIGIEVSGYHNQYPSAEQILALRELLDKIQSRYGIRDEFVLPHSMVAYGAPSRFHKRSHRGRRRCAMNFSLPDLRRAIGLNSQPALDPDVSRGVLVVADLPLYRLLFGGDLSLMMSEPPTLVAELPPPPRRLLSGSPSPAVSRSPSPPLSGSPSPPQSRSPSPPPRRLLGGSPSPPPKPLSLQPVRKRQGYSPRIEEEIFRKEFALVTSMSFDTTDEPPHEPAIPDTLVVHSAFEAPEEVAGEEALQTNTIYFLPNGEVKSGSEFQAKTGSLLQAGTEVLVGYQYGGFLHEKTSLPEQTYWLPPILLDRWEDPGTYYRLPSGEILNGEEVSEVTLPVGTFFFFDE